MKKSLFILFSLISIYSFGQPIIQRAGASNTVKDERVYPNLNLFVPKYADTIAANVQKGIDSAGAIIYTYNTKSFWYRQHSPKKWVEFGSGGVPTVSDGLIYVDSIKATGSLQVTVYATSLSPAIWRISGNDYYRYSDSVFTITAATSGYYRKDIIVGNTLGKYQLIQGLQSATTAVQPTTPTNTVLVSVLDISGSSVAPPSPDLTQYFLLNGSNTVTGDSTTFNNKVIFKWLTEFYGGTIRLKNQSSPYYTTLTYNASANRLQSYPDKSGVISLRIDTLDLIASKYRLDSTNNALSSKVDIPIVSSIVHDTIISVQANINKNIDSIAAHNTRILANTNSINSLTSSVSGKLGIADSTQYSTKANATKQRDSVQANVNANTTAINLRVKYADTSTGYGFSSSLRPLKVFDSLWDLKSANVNLLNAAQTITAAKTITALSTFKADNLLTTQDYTKGILLQNATAADVTNKVQYSPALVFESQIWGGDGTGGMNASATSPVKWKIEQRPVYSGAGGSLNDNNLVFSTKLGNNSWSDIATFTKSGLTSTISQTTLNLGVTGVGNGQLNFKRSSDGSVVGYLAANASYFGVICSGVFSTDSKVAIGGTYTTTLPLTPSNGLYVAGESVFTAVRTSVVVKTTNYTLTSADETVKVTTAGVTQTLPTAVGCTGRQYTVVNASNGIITVATTSSQTIGNYTTNTTLSIPSDSSYVFKSDGVGWLIVSKF